MNTRSEFSIIYLLLYFKNMLFNTWQTIRIVQETERKEKRINKGKLCIALNTEIDFSLVFASTSCPASVFQY